MFYIYCITNNLNGKTYIGQRKCPEDKTPDTDKGYMGSGFLISKAHKKYGIKNFSKSILAITETKENINILEKHFIALFREEGKAEYNLADGGQGGLLNEHHRQRIIESNLNRKVSFETKLKISKSVTGHKDSLEVRLKKSLSHKGKSSGVKGVKFSEETRKKMSLSHKGKKLNFSEEHRKHLSEAMKKRPVSEMEKARLRTLYLGRKHTEETKRKMSEIKKGKPSNTFGKHWKIVDDKRIYY